MNIGKRILAAIVACAGMTAVARGQTTYQFTSLNTNGLNFSQGYDIAEGLAVGYGIGPATGGVEHAFAWPLDGGSRRDISNGVFRTMATSVDDQHQVAGIAFTIDALRQSKVAFWSNPSSTPVLPANDLSWGEGYAVSGSHYVGWGHRLQAPNAVPDRGFVWNNDGSSQRVALESPRNDGMTTFAESIDGNWVAGDAQITGTDRRGAAAWDITNLSNPRAVDLHPDGYDWSQTGSIRGTTAVGLARTAPVGQAFNHAFKWDVTTGAAQDLHTLVPATFVGSAANDVAGDTVVGSVMDSAGNLKAAAWDLGSNSYIDLAQFLPAGITFSAAEAINRSGQIVGEYWFGSEDRHIFVLSPNWIAGDANADGAVNLLDFNVLAENFGKTGRAWSQGDFTRDGAVTLADFNALAANFGLSASASGPSPQDWAALSSAVPEPTLSVGSLALLVLARRRRVR
jgi:uncharacterized membrane protein